MVWGSVFDGLCGAYEVLDLCLSAFFVLFVCACACLPLSFLLLPWQFEDFFEEVYQELSKFGEISEMNVCDNLGDHLIGNVYVKVRYFL